MTKDQKIELLERVPPMKAVARMALPTVLSQVVTLLYNLADTFFVGQLNDPMQLAALSLSFPIFMVIILLGNLFGIGANSVIARALGRGDYDYVKKVSSFAVYGSIVGAAITAIVAAFTLRDLLWFLGASEGSIDYACSYLRYVFVLGLVPSVLQLTLAHIIRSEGASRQASIGLALGGGLNILLDPVFILVFRNGVAGAGIATLVSNSIALVYFLLVMYRARNSTFLSLRPVRVSWSVMREVLTSGLPSSAIVFFGSAANFVMIAVAAPYGDVVLAAYGIMQKFSGISIHLANGVAQGTMPLLAYSYANRNYDRLRRVSRIGLWAVFLIGAVLILFFELFPEQSARLFAKDAATIAETVRFVKLGIPGCFGASCVCFFNSAFQAYGRWKRGFFLCFLRQMVVFVPVIFLFETLFQVTGLALSYTVSEIISFALGLTMFLTLMPRVRREVLGK